MTMNTNNKTKALWCALAYAYLRFAYELLVNFPDSTSLVYLLGMIIGLHGLQFWLRHTSQQSDQEATLANNVQTIALVIICIALVMDAARFTLGLLS